MKQSYFIGVDISKEKIDLAVVNTDNQVLFEKIIRNEPERVLSCLRGLIRKLKTDNSQLLVCCEATGIYSEPLKRACYQGGFSLWVEQAYKIKKATTNFRGKSDRKDAQRIAEYALRFADRQFLYKPDSCEQSQLKTLLGARETVLLQYNQLKQQLSESKQFDPEKYKLQKTCFAGLMATLQRKLKEIEKQIASVVASNQAFAKNVALLRTIPGIGMQNALNMVVQTNNFTTFSSASHLACYAGVVPFPNQSGNVNKGSRVSKFANKSIKRLLHMAAMAAIKAKGELKAYFIRKVKEGKNKMSVLNAIRNKLVKRMFAVIQRQEPYLAVLPQNNSINEENACFLT